MKQMGRAARASGAMAASMAVMAVCRFARNVILARMLLPADFGVGATFTLTLTFLELLTELGPSKQLVQAREGAQESWQGVAHTILAIRGLLIATALFLAAGPVSGWLHVPEAINAFRCLALAPLLRGFEHLDACRFQRDLKLARLSLVEGVPSVASLLVAPLAAWWLQDYRAFLVVTLVAAGSRLLISHAVALRPYRLSFDRSILGRFIAFGWPLIGNSLLMFLILHGERLLVATWFDLATLGAYSVALALAFTPAQTLARLHGSVALPMFSRSQDDPAALRRAIASSAQVLCLAGGLLAVAFVLAGSWLVGVCYSEKYLLAQQVVPWIGLMCAVRIVRATPAMLSIAVGDTKIALYSNVARALSFGAAAWLLSEGMDVVWAPICGFAGELVAYGVSLVLLKARHGAPVEESFKCFLGTAVVLAVVILLARAGLHGKASPIAAALGAVAVGTHAFASGDRLRDMLGSLVPNPFGATRG